MSSQRLGTLHARSCRVVRLEETVQGCGCVADIQIVDDAMAAALIDRLLHHCHIVNIRGNRYRMRAHQELWRSMQRTDGDARPTRGTEA